MIEYYITQGLASFITSAGFGIFFNSKPRTILAGGLTGMIGWYVYLISHALLGSDPVADFVAYILSGFVMGLLAKYFGRKTNASPTVFYVMGLIPPVPGGAAYRIFYSLFYGDYPGFMSNLRSIILTGASLALGILVASKIVEKYWPYVSGYNTESKDARIPTSPRNQKLY